MSPFEAQSLEVARGALAASWVADGLAFVALIASIVGGLLIYFQLTSARWNSLLSFEQDMQQRRSEVVAFALKMHDADLPANAQVIIETLKEGYLNSVDRLASSILNGQFPIKEMKQDYRDFITNVVREFPKEFQAGTKYRKVLRLYEKWQD